MGRGQSEIDKDDAAAKAVISSSTPRLKQAPAHSREDSFAARPREGDGGGRGRAAVSKGADPFQQKKEGTKGAVALASGTFSEETKQEIEADSSAAKTSTEKKKEKVCKQHTDQ